MSNAPQIFHSKTSCPNDHINWYLLGISYSFFFLSYFHICKHTNCLVSYTRSTERTREHIVALVTLVRRSAELEKIRYSYLGITMTYTHTQTHVKHFICIWVIITSMPAIYYATHYISYCIIITRTILRHASSYNLTIWSAQISVTFYILVCYSCPTVDKSSIRPHKNNEEKNHVKHALDKIFYN